MEDINKFIDDFKDSIENRKKIAFNDIDSGFQITYFELYDLVLNTLKFDFQHFQNCFHSFLSYY